MENKSAVARHASPEPHGDVNAVRKRAPELECLAKATPA